MFADDAPYRGIAAVAGRLWVRVQQAWVWIWNPDMAYLATQMRDSGVFHLTTVLPPDADSAAVLAWFEERMDCANQHAAQACGIYSVPSGVNPNRKKGRAQTRKLGEWSGTGEAWEDQGREALGACVPPIPHDRLLLSMLLTLPRDDDERGTPHTNQRWQAYTASQPGMW